MGETTVQADLPSGAETKADPGRNREWTRRAADARWGSLEERLWSRVREGGPDECWPWTGARNRAYGRMEAFGRKNTSPHRVAWFVTHGAIPEAEGYHGMVICHRCDNPPCCNPDHLFVGTQGDNIRDAMAKGRHGSLKQAGKKRGPYRKKAA